LHKGGYTQYPPGLTHCPIVSTHIGMFNLKGGYVDEHVRNGDERYNMIETDGKKCPSDYAKMRSRSKKMVSVFTIHGSS
jgi:hypothetical protein